VKLSFKRKVHGEGQELYGSVSLADVAEALEAKGFKLEKKKIQLHEPIKVLGEFSIPVKLHTDVVVPILVEVAKDEEATE
jgi:large subunit ribosomal protein L9